MLHFSWVNTKKKNAYAWTKNIKIKIKRKYVIRHIYKNFSFFLQFGPNLQNNWKINDVLTFFFPSKFCFWNFFMMKRIEIVAVEIIFKKEKGLNTSDLEIVVRQQPITL